MSDRRSRLDILMELTGSRNSALSRAVSFDPSHISRIRAGTRSMPKNRRFLSQAAAYFSKRITTEEQRAALSRFLPESAALPDEPGALQRLLEDWLSEDDPVPENPVESFLSNLARAPGSAERNIHLLLPGTDPSEIDSVIRQRTAELLKSTESPGIFYGNEGKRNAVEAFLGSLVTDGYRGKLLLFSDEDMSWLSEDASFFRRWAVLLLRLLGSGVRILIAHDLSRDTGEMFEAITGWLPLYLTGGIEPYYCPKLRDRIFRRSVFVASGHSALFAESVGNRTDEMPNILIRDHKAAKAFEKEFFLYLDQCRPLISVYRPDSSGKELLASVLKFEQERCSSYIAHALPFAGSMPPSLVRSMNERTDGSLFAEYQSHSAAALRALFRAGLRFTEILNLPAPEELRSGNILLPLTDFLNAPATVFTAEDMKLHLKSIIRLLKRESLYRVILSSAVPSNIILHVKEGTGAGLSCEGPSDILFALSEPRLTEALYEYLLRIEENAEAYDRETVIRKLEGYIREIS